MAKELPYFRFTPQEWQNGDISLESYELQGFFISLCSYYWVQNCSITKAMLEKKFKHDKTLIDSLISLEIISHNTKTDFIEIAFLNEQFDMLSTKRKARQVAGSKGGKQKASNATNLLKQKPSYKDKDKEKDNDNSKTPTDKEATLKFLTFFNAQILKHKGKEGKFSVLSKTDLNNLKKLKESFPDHNDWLNAFSAMYESPWVQENNMLTPTHFLVNANFQKYLNTEIKKPKREPNEISPIGETPEEITERVRRERGWIV
jgi:hypothetical protein